MKAARKTELVEAVYWDCGNSEHRHKSERVAQNCIDREAKKGPPAKRWSREELIDIESQNNNCDNSAALARKLRMSATNLSRLVRRAERIKRYEERTGKVWRQ